MPTTEIAQPIYFDADAHAEQIAAADATLAAARTNSDKAATALADAKEALARTLNNPESPEAIAGARGVVEFAEIVASNAERDLVVARANRDQLNADDSLAVALLPFGRELVKHHPRITVVATPGDLTTRPDPDGDPVLVIQQVHPAEVGGSGALGGEVELRYYRDPILHRPVLETTAILHALAEVDAWSRRSTEYLTATEGERYDSLTLDVGTYPEVPTVSGQVDADAVATVLADSWSTIGEWSRRSVVGTFGQLSVTDYPQGDQVERVVTFGAGVQFRSGLFDEHERHGELLALFRGWVDYLVGRPVNGLGRVTGAELVDRGNPYTLSGGITEVAGLRVRLSVAAILA